MTGKPKVVVTLPAYHAERTLAKTFAAIPTGLADHVILVDDASTDDTVRVARELGLHVVVHAENRGYGGNQKTCYLEALRAGADIVVLLHPDYQYDPAAVPLLAAPILAGYADMTFGSRFAGLGDPLGGGMPLYRYVGNRLSTKAENLLLGARFTETHSGLRAYTRDCLLSLPILNYSDDFAFDSQLLVDAITSAQRVIEVPISTRYTEESSSISIARSVKYVRETLSYCARQVARNGRRGRRSAKVTGARVPEVAEGREYSTPRPCVLCGDDSHVLIHPANAEGDVTVDEFACTTRGLATHDDIVQCRQCGLVSSVPTLDAAEIAANYADVTDEVYLHEEASRRELFRWCARVLGGYAVRGDRLLEVGANAGLFLDVARDEGWKATGVEPSAWAVEQGKQRFGVDLRQGTAEDIDLAPGSADAVVLFDVLEHLVDPVAALRRLRQVIDDEGVLVLSTVSMASLHARLRKGSWPWFIRSHLFYFTPETLGAVLRAAGFRTVAWKVVPRSFHLSYLAERMAASTPTLSRLADLALRIADLKLPVGWLGDIVLVVARPEAQLSLPGGERKPRR